MSYPLDSEGAVDVNPSGHRRPTTAVGWRRRLLFRAMVSLIGFRDHWDAVPDVHPATGARLWTIR